MAQAAEKPNPISRVVELLNGLTKKVESDGKAEEELFEKYQCWYKTVVSTKSASNNAAAERITELTNYIDDIEGGRVEFTSERGDLTAQLAELNGELEKAKNIREKENEDFLAAKDEMEKAIAALEEATTVMSEGTEGAEEGELLAMKFDVRKVVALGKSMLSKKDAKFLERALDEEVPVQDHKKMNRKATFKMKYKMRSGKIQEIMADMLKTFQENLEDATKKEDDAQAFYDKLKSSKEEERNSVEAAAGDMSKETAARNLAKDESQKEKEALETQKENDEKFIKETEDAYAAKTEEWKERCRLRTEELASISKAIGVLNDDDARDNFRKSQESQSFIQEARCSSAKAKHAAAAIRHAAKGSAKLTAMASRVAHTTAGHFDKVVEDLGKQITKLEEAQTKDDTERDDCVKNRKEKTEEAKKLSQTIDDNTAHINQRNDEIAELNKQIDTATTEIEDLEKELQEAKDIRNLENEEYRGNKAADEEAVRVIEKTKATLKKFYEDNGLSFVQVGASVHRHLAKPEMSAAGEAPPPPPQTFSEPYGGAKGETEGIQGILDGIKADTEADIKEADRIEDDTQKAFDEMKDNTFSTVSNLEQQIADFETQRGDKEQDVTSTQEESDEKHSQLDGTITYLKEITPGCDYIATNHEMRKNNRDAEIKGLGKAKDILEGASFLQGGFMQKPC